MAENLKELLEKYWAKSDGTTIREHTDKLLENLDTLRGIFGDLIEERVPKEFRGIFWEALKITCEYHDYGKIHSHFQKKVGNNSVKPSKDLPEVRHNLISPAFVSENLEPILKDIVSLAIINHHDYEPNEEEIKKLEKVLEKEFNTILKYRKLLKKSEYDVVQLISQRHGKRNLEKFYILLKGFLLRIDHSSSNKFSPKIEAGRIRENALLVRNYLKQEKNSDLNNLQKFILNNDGNLLIVASTGYGKTEAGFLFLKDKGFFTLPIRTSVNSIYERAKRVFGEKNVGLLHSTALIYRLSLDERERNSLEEIVNDYHLTKNFGKPIIVSTPDQFFPFILRPKGFEKYVALLSYSRVVLDELQLFEPHTLGFIVKALQKIKEFGGKVMVMTATLPTYVEKDLEFLEYKKGIFLKNEIRHNLRIVKDSILNFTDQIRELSRSGKVLVITNTIKRALELKSLIPEAFVIHGHFIQKHRKEREKEIHSFFEAPDERGIWITTQLAEVSLDLDADFLITELSTADSLIQRMGRVNRKGLKDTRNPNVFILTEDCSGIGSVYRRKIHDITLSLLKEGKITEEEKIEFVRKTYTRVIKEDKDYIEKYEKAKDYIDNLWSLKEKFNKEKAQKLFRDIHSYTVIPEVFREELEPLLEAYTSEKDTLEKYKLLGKILDYTFTIQAYRAKNIEPVYGLKGVYWIKGKYSEEIGFEPGESEDNIV